jgi:Fibronectin type III domain
VAHFPPVRPTPPATASDPVPSAARLRPRRSRLVLLLGAGAAILLAGLVWVIVAAVGPGPGSPAAQATVSASPKPAGPLARYRATGVRVARVAARPRGAEVQWDPPSRAADVIAFVVVAELDGRVQQEHTVGSAGRSAVFTGLRAGRRYCFVVGTVVEAANGQAGTASAPPVCAVTG